MKLAFGLQFKDLYGRDGLLRLDAAFLGFLQPDLRLRVETSRKNPPSKKEESELLVALAAHLEDFVAKLFGIEAEARALAEKHNELAPLYSVKRLFVQRRAMHKVKPEDASPDGFDFSSELDFARRVSQWLADEKPFEKELEGAARYAAWALSTPQGREKHRAGILFKAPRKLDFMRLVPVETIQEEGFQRHSFSHFREREGFKLTDPGTDLAGALDQTNYCIWCHEQGKDSCSKGLKEKAPSTDFKKTVFGVPLAGCPLEEKISEFQMVKSRGQPIGALAIIAVDNPMVAATGHRICNDCMKSCIYQKQDPVDIPQAETRTLKDVLELPWGFEIYSLLTRWNPLDLRRPYPKASTNKKILVVGLGPAGFTLAHHLMNDGHAVVGIDGLKIEPLGVDFSPIKNIDEIREDLDERTMAGFGGVAEYGITVRWDKNFLRIVRLLLERRSRFRMFGGVRFGGTLTLEDAFAPQDAGGMGFDHVALCIGAGKPTVLDIPNGLARGVRAASDFLMALQLTGAAKIDSIANMQLRLPVVVIGGGLTAIDTATESLAYYVVQVEKFLARYEALSLAVGEDAVRKGWDDQEREVAEEFLAHGRAIRAERTSSLLKNHPPRIVELLRSWGGSTIAYRRKLVESPSYTLNHEEVEKALEEGITFAEGLTPLAVDTDNYGAAKGMRFRTASGETWLPAHTLFVAAGTQPNTVLAREDGVHFRVDGKYFAACDEQGNPVKPQHATSKPAQADVLLSRRPDGRFVSFFGDVHPSYFGNVVKAMGSAKQGYPIISRVLLSKDSVSKKTTAEFFNHLSSELGATVHHVARLTPTIVEVVVKAPLAARKFQPGQFYRLQNFESLAPLVKGAAPGDAGTRLQMEGLALTGAWVDREKGLVSTIVLEMGGSSDLCALLKEGEPVILMGPTGAPTEIHGGETVLLCGGGLGNAVLFSIGQAFRAAGSKVLYFAGYKKAIDRYKTSEIERAADAVVWCCDEEPGFKPARPQDRSFVGNIVQAMDAYASGRLGAQTLRLQDADRIIAIGSDRMMAAVARARHDVLAPYLKPQHIAIGSINSPMQCMMKEICAQCLQPHVDPATGKTTWVFSCFNQDQPLDLVDFGTLNERLKQNSLSEKLTAQWIRHCMPALKKERSFV